MGWERSEAKSGQGDEVLGFLDYGTKVGVLREDLIESMWVQRGPQQGKETCRLS